MFHATDLFVTGPSSTAVGKTEKKSGLIRALVILGTTTCILLLLWALRASQVDPYIQATLNLQGSEANGARLFRMNCVGCHGISAQGLVGPELNEVSIHLTDREIINQIVKGRTPPMPSFQMEPQAMADLLAHLHSLS